MKYLRLCRGREHSDHYKWGYPKMHISKGQWVCDSKFHVVILRNSEPHIPMKTWNFLCCRVYREIQKAEDSLYKVRTTVKHTINYFKTNMCIALSERETAPLQKLMQFYDAVNEENI